MISMDQLKKTMRDNEIIVQILSEYINLHPRFLTREMVEDLARDCRVSAEEAFCTLFAAACGLDSASDRYHRALERTYFEAGVKKLDPTPYQNDPYVKTVRFPTQTLGKWETCEHSYAPYEPFVRKDPILLPSFCEIPQIGYFDEEFSFPAVLENGIEWMTVTPNEVETMRQPIATCHGRTLTFGLGLGYFAFHASEKENVESVTVIEQSADVIKLFQTHILPQFPHKEKIRIIQADAFAYLDALSDGEFDVLFADLWHDPSDGLDMYLRIKAHEKRLPNMQFTYWIEPSLLSLLRRMVFRRMSDTKEPLQLRGVAPETLLSDAFLRTLDLRKTENG